MNDYIERKTSAEERRKQRFVNKSAAVSVKYLRKVDELPHKPDALEPFMNILRHVFVDMQGAVKPDNMPTVGTYCVMVPPELIYAAGAMPVKLCGGSYTAFNIGDDIAPRDVCPLVKAVMGFQSIGVMPIYQECSMMAVPITCDCKKKLAGYLGQHRRTVTLHVPSGRDRDEDMEQYVRELYLFSQSLTELTHRRGTVRAVALHRAEAQGSARDQGHSLYGCYERHELYSHLTLDGVSQRAQRRARAEDKARRNGIKGEPPENPHHRLAYSISELQASAAYRGDGRSARRRRNLYGRSMGERGAYDPPAIVDQSTDGIMRALANKSTRPCTCPTFTDNKRRVYRIMQMLKDYNVQGVIYHVLRGCLVYDYEYQVLEEELGKLNIPVIRVESDYNEEDVEQLRIRVEAFIELIKYGKG